MTILAFFFNLCTSVFSARHHAVHLVTKHNTTQLQASITISPRGSSFLYQPRGIVTGKNWPPSEMASQQLHLWPKKKYIFLVSHEYFQLTPPSPTPPNIVSSYRDAKLPKKIKNILRQIPLNIQ